MLRFLLQIAIFVLLASPVWAQAVHIGHDDQSHGEQPSPLDWYIPDAADYQTNRNGSRCLEVPKLLHLTGCFAYTSSGTVSLDLLEKSDPSVAGSSILLLSPVALTADADGAAVSGGFKPTGETFYDVAAGLFVCPSVLGSPGAVGVGIYCHGAYSP